MGLFHISRERWDSVRSGSYKLGNVKLSRQGPSLAYDNEYHFIDGEHGLCGECGQEFESILVSSPVDLEYFKLAQKGLSPNDEAS